MFQTWVYPGVPWYCYANNLIPSITKPIITNIMTLIENIFSNNYKDYQKQERGITYADLSDHFPIYNISKISTRLVFSLV